MEIGPIPGGFELPVEPVKSQATELSDRLEIDALARIGDDTYTASNEETASGMESSFDDQDETDEISQDDYPAENDNVTHHHYLA